MNATTTTVTSTPFTDIGTINEVVGTPCTPGWSPPPGPGGNLLLDDYPDAAAAYSVRLLRTAYSGSALRVRRNVAPFDEQDIGFTSGGDLDEAAIVAFGGSDVLTVSAWYDQSGQSNHATQGTAGEQPYIYDGAAVITENGKPLLDASRNGTGRLAHFDASYSSGSPLTIAAVGVVVGNGRIISSGSTQDMITNMTQLTSGGTGIFTSSKTGQVLTFAVSDGANSYIGASSSSSQTSNTGTTGNWSGTSLKILNLNNDRHNNGQEIILWSSNQNTNRTGIETDINDYFSIY